MQPLWRDQQCRGREGFGLAEESWPSAIQHFSKKKIFLNIHITNQLMCCVWWRGGRECVCVCAHVGVGVHTGVRERESV